VPRHIVHHATAKIVFNSLKALKTGALAHMAQSLQYSIHAGSIRKKYLFGHKKPVPLPERPHDLVLSVNPLQDPVGRWRNGPESATAGPRG
jgi:hypothetical protein